MRLAAHSYRTLAAIRGPLIFVDQVFAARIGEQVSILAPDGRRFSGEVLKIDRQQVLLQVYGETAGLSLDQTCITFEDSVKRVPVSLDCLGRIYSGSFEPIDDRPEVVAEHWPAVSGAPMNPLARHYPRELIETGLSAIDGLNTLVKGQKLPIFSCAGLPAGQLVARILQHARAPGGGPFVVVFAALGLTHNEYEFFRATLADLETQFVAIINLANEAAVERLLAPRCALTVAEYLAFVHGYDVLVVVADMLNYCDALREVATAREELPGRRGYPGYLYSDLASLYERAGRLRDRPGSVTMLPLLTMPDDDITHPVPDLTGYITEGQLVLSRELHQRGIFPPIDVLPSLSRLMQHGIGTGRTRADHRQLADRLYRTYAKGRELRRLAAVVGQEGLLEEDRRLLRLAERIEQEYIHQGSDRRSITATLDLIGKLLQVSRESTG